MSRSDDARHAMSHVLELLVRDDDSIAMTIDKVAKDYGLKPNVIEGWLSRSFPTSEALTEWRTQQRLATQRQTEWQIELGEVQDAANKWAQGVWKNCEPDGEPGWDYCCDRFLEAHAVQKEDLRIAARRIFRATGEEYEAARRQYLANKRDDQ